MYIMARYTWESHTAFEYIQYIHRYIHTIKVKNETLQSLYSE